MCKNFQSPCVRTQSGKDGDGIISYVWEVLPEHCLSSLCNLLHMVLFSFPLFTKRH